MAELTVCFWSGEKLDAVFLSLWGRWVMGDLCDGGSFLHPRCCRTDNLGSGRTMQRLSALSNELGTRERQGGV